MTARGSRRPLAAGALAALLVAGCSSSGHRAGPGRTATTPPGASSTTSPAHRGGLPPLDEASLRAIVVPILDRFDADVQRVAVEIDTTGARNAVFSLYARPRTAITPDRYAAQIAPLTKAVVPLLLRRYPGLYAVDVCQEQLHPPANTDEPPPVTRVLVTRPHLAETDWDALDLRLVRAQSRKNLRDPVIQLYVDEAVGASATFRSAAPT